MQAISRPDPSRRWLDPVSLAITLGFAVIFAVVISPWFKTGFVVLLARSLVLGLVLLLVFNAAQRWPEAWRPRWLPRWLVAVIAIAAAVPMTTYAIYTAALGGDPFALAASEPHLWGFRLTASTALVLGLVVALGTLLRQRELQFALERSRLEKQAVDARLALLQAQIEPHFLFNTLANVQALVESGSPQAAPVLKSLIGYLRAALPRLHEGPATLAQEIDLVRAYLDLMVMRMPDRLGFAIDVAPDLLAERFPPMALLTLVENAVRHGVDPLEQGGRIDVQARRDGASGFAVHVRDNGAGIDPRRPPGTGLSNLRERLAGFFGCGAELQLEERGGGGVEAIIRVRPRT